MADRNGKPGDTLPPNIKTLQQELAELDNQLYRLVCVVHVHHVTLQAALEHEGVNTSDTRWLFGLTTLHHWLDDMGLTALKQLEHIAAKVKQKE